MLASSLIPIKIIHNEKVNPPQTLLKKVNIYKVYCYSYDKKCVD